MDSEASNGEAQTEGAKGEQEMKLICPWCGAQGHDGHTERERQTPAMFEYVINVDHGGKRILYECLNCHQGVKATRRMGRTSPMPPEDFEYAKQLRAERAREIEERLRQFQEEDVQS